MATKTTNYKLIKDGPNEYYDIEKLNANLDKIDTAIGTKVDKTYVDSEIASIPSVDISGKVDKVVGKGLSTNDYSNAEKQKVANNKSTIDTHIADDDLIKHKAKQIELQDTANLFASTNVEAGMGELFTNVSNGKDLVSGAITGVDESVVIPTEPSFGDLASAIGGISTGKKWAKGSEPSISEFPDNKDYFLNISNLGFSPSTVLVMYTKRSTTDSGRSDYIITYTDSTLSTGKLEITTNTRNARGDFTSDITANSGGFSVLLSKGSGSSHNYRHLGITWIAYE